MGLPEGRAKLNLGIFKDSEADWIFKRALTFMNEKAAEIGECLYVASKIDEKSNDSWVTEWGKMAEAVENRAREALEKHHLISARECFLRACNYYRVAEYGAFPDDPRFHKFWEKSRDCFKEAGSLFNPPIQTIEVPFEGKKLPGYFWRPDDSDKKRPTLVAAGGADSSGEEIVLWTGMAAVRRGYNFFMFEHPGHRGAVHLYNDCIKRPDYEAPYKAGLDVLEKLPGVDERIALTGYSFGGFVVTRVAAFEKRIKAVIPNNPILKPTEIFMLPGIIYKLPLFLLLIIIDSKAKKASPLTKSWTQYSNWTRGEYGLKSSEILLKNAGKIKKGEGILDIINRINKLVITGDILKMITCPALGLVGADEGKIMLKQAQTFYAGISSKVKKLHILSLDKDGSNDHCQLDNRSVGNQVMYDWLDEIFEYR